MCTIKTTYEGNLRTIAEHVQSGTQLITDAPTDNHGKGESFSPTDLLAASLTSCMLTIMGIVSQEHKLDLDGITVKTTKIMQHVPRKVAEIIVDFHFPVGLAFSDQEKRRLTKAAETCPVYLSLHPDIKKTLKFNW